MQEAQLFTDLLGDHGKPVWPLWELVKWLVGMSSHTLPAIGEEAGASAGTGELLNGSRALAAPREGTLGFTWSSFRLMFVMANGIEYPERSSEDNRAAGRAGSCCEPCQSRCSLEGASQASALGSFRSSMYQRTLMGVVLLPCER